MNFLLRTHPIAPELPTVHESVKDVQASRKSVNTLEGLISKNTFIEENGETEYGDSIDSDNADGIFDASSHDYAEKYSDVTDDEGWVTIPFKKLPENWSSASNIEFFQSFDRSFVFPGEKIHILACLAASKRDTEVITPFKVAALMSKNNAQQTKEHKKNIGQPPNSVSLDTDINGINVPMEIGNKRKNGQISVSLERGNTDVEKLVRMEDHRHQTEALLKRFSNSHFFVRIAEADEELWSKRSMVDEIYVRSNKTTGVECRDNFVDAVIDRGHFDGNAYGLARNTGRCWSLQNGDIVVLLEVNIGSGSFKNPILEVLQFEKFPVDELSTENDQISAAFQDPCQELLKWLLPLDHTLPLPTHPLSHPPSSLLDVESGSQKSMFTSSSSSRHFSFGNFRSYSMSTLPQASTSNSADALPHNSKPTLDLEDLDYSKETLKEGQSLGTKEHLSFRGVQLEPERYFVQCGLGGMYLPGRRWRRKVEIIQPIEIQSFSAECNTEDLLCVQIKNILPDHIPDIIVYVDAISIVFEEAPISKVTFSLPLSCTEAGKVHHLPNLALRRGEEHAFILKPTSDLKFIGDKSSLPLESNMEISSINKLMIPSFNERNAVVSNKYAILVSFRCNYTESKLFLKKPTSWKPRIMRNLIVSVSSKVSERTFGPQGGGISELPIQELTLEATNSTDDDLTLTVLAPASLSEPPSVLPRNSSLTSPISPFSVFPRGLGRMIDDKWARDTSMQKMTTSDGRKESSDQGPHSTSSHNECTVPVPDFIQDSELGCTHLWLQSTIPLGCIPARSCAKVKLELLPLKDGIITLDTLQIDVKEKGLSYVPEYPLKIHAASTVSTEIS